MVGKPISTRENSQLNYIRRKGNSQMSNKEKVMILYDKIEEIQELGNYASIETSNFGHEVNVTVMRGEFESGKSYEVNRSFDFKNENAYVKTVKELDEFINSFKEKEMTLAEIEEQLGHKVKIVGGH